MGRGNVCVRGDYETLFYVDYDNFSVILVDSDGNIKGLQARHFQSYRNGLRDALFEQFEELGVYGGAWTSGRIRRAG